MIPSSVQVLVGGATSLIMTWVIRGLPISGRLGFPEFGVVDEVVIIVTLKFSSPSFIVSGKVV